MQTQRAVRQEKQTRIWLYALFLLRINVWLSSNVVWGRRQAVSQSWPSHSLDGRYWQQHPYTIWVSGLLICKMRLIIYHSWVIVSIKQVTYLQSMVHSLHGFIYPLFTFRGKNHTLCRKWWNQTQDNWYYFFKCAETEQIHNHRAYDRIGNWESEWFYPRITSSVWVWIQKNVTKLSGLLGRTPLGASVSPLYDNFALGRGDLYTHLCRILSLSRVYSGP